MKKEEWEKIEKIWMKIKLTEDNSSSEIAEEDPIKDSEYAMDLWHSTTPTMQDADSPKQIQEDEHARMESATTCAKDLTALKDPASSKILTEEEEEEDWNTDEEPPQRQLISQMQKPRNACRSEALWMEIGAIVTLDIPLERMNMDISTEDGPTDFMRILLAQKAWNAGKTASNQ